MDERKIAPYGAWKSPITADLVVAGSVGIGQVMVDNDAIYWAESRPAEGGRIVVVRRSADGTITDVTLPGFNVRTRVHEYGGGAYLVDNGIVYFTNFSDQRLYRQELLFRPQPLTPKAPMRYADAVLDQQRNRLICVCEDHSSGEPINTLVAIALHESDAPRVLVAGNDFYSTPRLNPEGTRLAWLTWNHPNMPWDGTELWVGDVVAGGAVGAARLVAGGSDESIFQPTWSPQGELYFVSDHSGWWNLYRLHDGQVEALCPMDAEFGLPQWVFRMETFAFESAHRLVCVFCTAGRDTLAILDAQTGTLDVIDTPYTSIEQPNVVTGNIIFVGSSPTEPAALVLLNLETLQTEVLRRSSEVPVDAGSISIAQPVTFPTEGDVEAYGFFYTPRNRDFVAPPDELPPLLVMIHGGPTAATSNTLSLKIQYWTSRGFAVLDVNYGGSTGYGRAYRQRLNGQWGVVDVDDCVNGARYLVNEGMVDSKRMAIRGGSAGGYTTLCALTFRDVFTAGASHYGVGDAVALAEETHKFEARYLDRLIGPYPQQRDLYIERSPINFVQRLNCPVIFFQGLEDKIVPPNQAETMVAALRARGIPVAYVPFPDEQHGFRKAENIKRALESELFFYARVFGFELADAVEEVIIEGG